MTPNPYRSLPAVNDVLAAPAAADLVRAHGHDSTVEAIRTTLAGLRERLAEGEDADGELSPAAVAAAAATLLDRRDAARLRPVINATGIIIHTNLGRAPLPTAALAAQASAAGYVNLELDLASGERSSRQEIVREAICRLTGAKSAAVVNNCAAATLLVLRALATGREVIVSRGQLVEIGGSFRIPEIMAASGAVLREVGTTNITRLADYQAAIAPGTAALLRVHQSNFRIRGFTETPSLEALVEVARSNRLWTIDDIGSGALLDLASLGLAGEPTAAASIRAGADVVMFSGDKLLGGPQAGIIAGRAELIRRIERDPLMRAVRPDKIALAGLDATLRLYRDPATAFSQVPVLRLLSLPLEQLTSRARSLARQISAVQGVNAIARKDSAFVGGGSLPDQALPTAVVAVIAAGIDEHDLARRLRTGNPAVLCRVQSGAVLIDVRTVFAEQERDVVLAVQMAVAASPV
jgi:L-seryl-tRNA(Ser) seleniumtransferase